MMNLKKESSGVALKSSHFLVVYRIEPHKSHRRISNVWLVKVISNSLIKIFFSIHYVFCEKMRGTIKNNFLRFLNLFFMNTKYQWGLKMVTTSLKGLLRLDAQTSNRRRRYCIKTITQRVRCECSN